MLAYLGFLPGLRKSVHGKLACAALLCGLAVLQWFHFLHFANGVDPLQERLYLFLLFLIPVSFYFFSRAVLFYEQGLGLQNSLHLLPLSLGLLLPTAIAPGFAFLVGAGYTIWFAVVVSRLRQHSHRFHFEVFFFGLFALMAVLALLLGLSLPVIDHAIFYGAYAAFIGSAMALVTAAIIVFPELLNDIAEITEAAYQRSRLENLDVESLKERLHQLMESERVYENEDLTLAVLAEVLEISSHQLSELINTEFGVSFPRFVRQFRIAEAKRLLLEQPGASILSISMMTGFKSQSSFYAAFREATGQSPGHYRKS